VLSDYETLNSTECVVKPGEIVLTLTCRSGHMVSLLRIFLGNSTRGTCGYSAGDCTMDYQSAEPYPCIGTEFCRIILPSNILGKQIPKCKEDSTYIQALYQCIPGQWCTTAWGLYNIFVLLNKMTVRQTATRPTKYMICNAN